MIKTVTKNLDRFVEMLIVVSVILIIVLSILNIVLRWFHFSFTWIEPLVRHLVFLSAFMGAVMATASDRHIKVDLLQKAISKRPGLRKAVRFFYFIITFGVLSALAYSGYKFVESEFEYGKIVFWNLHSGFLTAIIPFGFILMSLRHLLSFFDKE